MMENISDTIQKEKKSIGYLIYKIIFLLSYPILMLFALFFMAIIGVFSWISQKIQQL